MLFGIQIQENCYKRLLEVVEQNFDWKDTINKFQDMFRCEKNKNPKWNNDIFEGNLAPQEGHRPKHKNVPEGFGGYSGTFICQWKKINNNAKVGDVIQAIIADFKEAVRIKKKLLLDSSLVQKVYQN